MARAAPARKAPKSRPSKEPFSFVLFLIGAFKLLKALLLIAVGIGALRFLHKDLAGAALHWAEVLRVDPTNRYVHGVLVRIFRVTPKQLRELSVGTFIYAALFATEGIGLLARKHWAEYFVIITTGLLIPLELYELFKHFTILKIAVLVVNVLIVWYLAVRVRRRSKKFA
ncbi:MAG TPA: DUF2127 domain-containing protein [Bryobacteraceae bacterium]|nr:DUF2127 domain-containing protein [Bryobacteraceae bacterium]